SGKNDAGEPSVFVRHAKAIDAVRGSLPVWTATVLRTILDWERTSPGEAATNVSPKSQSVRPLPSETDKAASAPSQRRSWRKSPSASTHGRAEQTREDGFGDAHETAQRTTAASASR